MSSQNLENKSELIDFETGEKLEPFYVIICDGEGNSVEINTKTYTSRATKDISEKDQVNNNEQRYIAHLVSPLSNLNFGSISKGALKRKFPNVYSFFDRMKC